jgi:chromosome segregation ATPase
MHLVNLVVLGVDLSLDELATHEVPEVDSEKGLREITEHCAELELEIKTSIDLSQEHSDALASAQATIQLLRTLCDTVATDAEERLAVITSALGEAEAAGRAKRHAERALERRKLALLRVEGEAQALRVENDKLQRKAAELEAASSVLFFSPLANGISEAECASSPTDSSDPDRTLLATRAMALESEAVLLRARLEEADKRNSVLVAENTSLTEQVSLLRESLESTNKVEGKTTISASKELSVLDGVVSHEESLELEEAHDLIIELQERVDELEMMVSGQRTIGSLEGSNFDDERGQLLVLEIEKLEAMNSSLRHEAGTCSKARRELEQAVAEAMSRLSMIPKLVEARDEALRRVDELSEERMRLMERERDPAELHKFMN